MKHGNLTKKVRAKIMDAVLGLQRARDLWTDSGELGLPTEQVEVRRREYETRAQALNAILDANTE